MDDGQVIGRPRAETPLHAVRLVDGLLELSLADGRTPRLHPLWLREHCPSPETHDPLTGQRLLDGWALALDLQITEAQLSADGVNLAWSDGHRALVPAPWLVAALSPPPDERDGLILWQADLSRLPEADWPTVATEDRALHTMLEQLRRYAFVIVRDVPVEMDGSAAVIERIGPMRRTNWGGTADVKAIAKAYDLTMTSRALEPHTDNPYREPVPGYIFLHCLANDAVGGESQLTDGFAIAGRLRESDPEAFAVLTQVRPRFRYIDETTVLEHSGALIELDEAERVRQVRLSNRTELVPPLEPATLSRYYAARRRFTDLVRDPAHQLQIKLAPGDLLIMDNYRLLHGRSAYNMATGHRHMRQSYMDRDMVGSRRKVLARTYG